MKNGKTVIIYKKAPDLFTKDKCVPKKNYFKVSEPSSILISVHDPLHECIYKHNNIKPTILNIHI